MSPQHPEPKLAIVQRAKSWLSKRISADLKRRDGYNTRGMDRFGRSHAPSQRLGNSPIFSSSPPPVPRLERDRAEALQLRSGTNSSNEPRGESVTGTDLDLGKSELEATKGDGKTMDAKKVDDCTEG